MKITKSQLKQIIKEEIQAVLSEMDVYNPPERSHYERQAEKAASVKFTRGPCKGMTAKEAMRAGCQPDLCDHLEGEDYKRCIDDKDEE